jgi:hypothetical protein
VAWPAGAWPGPVISLEPLPLAHLDVVTVRCQREGDEPEYRMKEPAFMPCADYDVIAVIVCSWHKPYGNYIFLIGEVDRVLAALNELGP